MTTYIVSSGVISSGITLNSGDSELVQSGGTALDTTINSGGQETVSAGGVDISATIKSGGTEFVYGSASATTVSSGGLEVVESGGVISGAIVDSGGVLDLSGDGTISGGTVVSGATVTVTGTSATLSLPNAASNAGLLQLLSGAVGQVAGTLANTGTLNVDTENNAAGSQLSVAGSWSTAARSMLAALGGPAAAR